MELVPQLAELGCSAPTCRATAARAEQRRLRPHHAGARARRLRAALLRLGAGLARDVPDLRLRLRRAEGALAAARWRAGEAIGCFGLTEPDFGSDPAACSRAPRGDGDGWRAQRHEAVDHQRHHRRRRGGLGEDRRTAIRGFLVEKGTPGLRARATSRASSRCAPRSPRSWSCRTSRVPDANLLPKARGPEGPALVPDPGALRHRLGRARRGDGLLRGGARLRPRARGAVRQADRRLPAHPGRSSPTCCTEITKGAAPRAARSAG